MKSSLTNNTTAQIRAANYTHEAFARQKVPKGSTATSQKAGSSRIVTLSFRPLVFVPPLSACEQCFPQYCHETKMRAHNSTV